MILEVVRSEAAHGTWLALHLREADRQELSAGSGETPAQAITRGLEASCESWTILAPEGPIAMFGVCPLVTGCAAVWLLGSDGIKTHYREFARRSQGIFDDLADRYGLLTNLVHPENTLHLRWLQWLGCEFGTATAHPVSGEPFIPFVYDYVRTC